MSKDVRITSDDGQVDVDEVHVNLKRGEKVVWYSHNNKGAIIAFASACGSPFHETHFQVPAGGSVGSGPVRDDVKQNEYKYTVVGPTGVNDPVVIIDY